MASRRVLRHPLPRVLVARPRLEARLDRVPPAGLGLLVASAGSGKSVLVGGWMRAQVHQRVAALTVEPHHDDAVVLARDLVAALREAAPELPAELAGLVVSGGATFGATFVTGLLAALDRLTRDLVIVVEDAHLLTNRSVRDDLGRILTALPDSTRALVTSRRDLGWPVRDLRLTGRLVELRGADLALDAAEGRELLVRVSERKLTDADVERLLDRTDGWVVGVQLAAISLQNVPDVASAVQSFAGSDRLVADYLLEEVIEQQEPEVRRFLLETSVLEWLSADVCDAVTGTANARRLLAELDQRSLFLVPLDRSGEVFRYHHLFADLLRYRLRVEAPEAAAPLRARAGDWLLEHGWLEDGIDQLLAAGEHARALDVIATSGHLLFQRGECATLVRWLSAVHDADPAPSVRLGINLMAAQTAADQSEAAAETYRHLLRREDLAPGERVAIDTLFAFMVFRGLPPETVLAVTARVLAALPELGESQVVDFLGLGGLDSVRAMATYASAVAELLRGEVPTAAATLEHLFTLPGSTYPVWRIYALGTLALAKAWLGQPGEALRLAAAALESAGSIMVSTHWAMTHAHLAAALAHLDRLELEPAAQALAQADLQNRLRPSSVVNHDLQRLIAARLTALQEGPAQALEMLAAPAEAPLEAPGLARANRTMAARLYVGLGRLPEAAAVVGPAHDLFAARIDLALAEGDLAAARTLVRQWRPAPQDTSDVVARQLRQCAIARAEGDGRGALVALRVAVATAEADRLRRPFVEVPPALHLLRRAVPHGSPLVDARMWELAGRLERRGVAQSALVEPLTERELAVLAYLPQRIKNQDIADELYVSVNTLKTHLRSIYRKLGAADRDQAVDRASELGLV